MYSIYEPLPCSILQSHSTESVHAEMDSGATAINIQEQGHLPSTSSNEDHDSEEAMNIVLIQRPAVIYHGSTPSALYHGSDTFSQTDKTSTDSSTGGVLAGQTTQVTADIEADTELDTSDLECNEHDSLMTGLPPNVIKYKRDSIDS